MSFSSITVLALNADIQKNISLKKLIPLQWDILLMIFKKKIIFIIIWQNRLFKSINDTSKVLDTDDNTTDIAE